MVYFFHFFFEKSNSFKKVIQREIGDESVQQIINKFFPEIDSSSKSTQESAVECLNLVITNAQSGSSSCVVNNIFPNLLKRLQERRKELDDSYLKRDKNNESISKEKNEGKLAELRKNEDTIRSKEHFLNVNLNYFLKVLETFLQKYGNYSLVADCFKQLIDLLSAFQLFSDINTRFLFFFISKYDI
jgi:hypothetical protein